MPNFITNRDTEFRVFRLTKGSKKKNKKIYSVYTKKLS